MSTADQLVLHLKLHGPQSAAALAEELGLTSMGVRKHLQQLTSQGLLREEDRAEGRGRPARYWSLTAAGHARFPDRHAEMTVQLLGLLARQLGPEALEAVVSAREAQMLAAYTQQLQDVQPLAARVAALADMRTAEGYMAEVRAVDGGWQLLEHHCPICHAAEVCQGFCRSELQQFAALLPEAEVVRQEHLLSGGQRCVYLIRAC